MAKPPTETQKQVLLRIANADGLAPRHDLHEKVFEVLACT
jgi:hypothetical protein